MAYPDGHGGCRTDGRGVTTADEAGIGDVAFLRVVIGWSAERHGTVDTLLGPLPDQQPEAAAIVVRTLGGCDLPAGSPVTPARPRPRPRLESVTPASLSALRAAPAARRRIIERYLGPREPHMPQNL